MNLPWSLLIAAVAIVIAVVVAYRRQSTSRSDRLCQLFDLEPGKHQLIGSDLGGSKDKVFLRADGVVGAPDAVFRRIEDRSIVIGEAKRRRLTGGPTTYERYQVMLYLGLARRKFGTDVQGVLRYGCGRVVSVEFDTNLYAELVSLLPDYHRAVREYRIA